MASIEDYQDFGVTLVDYVNASGSSLELQESFKEGSVLYSALKSLDVQEADLNTYQKNLLGAFKPGQEAGQLHEIYNHKYPITNE